MRKIKKSVRLSDANIQFIMEATEGDNFSECLEALIERTRLQDQFLSALAEKNKFVAVAKGHRNSLEASIRVLNKNNQLLKKHLESTERVLFHFKHRKEVDQYYDKFKSAKRAD